jgi:ADP-ribosylglycohydrolase
MTGTQQDRAIGAIIGALVGEALGVGPHWYYDLTELRSTYGDWIDDYTTPKPGRFHYGLKAGQNSQAGFILELMLRSLVERNGYHEADFCQRLDQELFPLLDGTPRSGPGNYTSESIRHAWKRRVTEKRPWHDIGGAADTAEAMERTLAIAVRYATEPARMSQAIANNTALTQSSETMLSMGVGYGCILARLIQGNAMGAQISQQPLKWLEENALSFEPVTTCQPAPDHPEFPLRARRHIVRDALHAAADIAAMAKDPAIRIEPAWKVSHLYGMPCAFYHQLPAAYYLAARFSDDFESAVLHAINGGGQNQSRAMLTGALVGAQVGLAGIPQRFLEGLERADELQKLTAALALHIPA